MSDETKSAGTMNRAFAGLKFVNQDEEDLRTYIATAALQGLCMRVSDTRMDDLGNGIQGGRREAKAAVQLADALIARLRES